MNERYSTNPLIWLVSGTSGIFPKRHAHKSSRQFLLRDEPSITLLATINPPKVSQKTNLCLTLIFYESFKVVKNGDLKIHDWAIQSPDKVWGECNSWRKTRTCSVFGCNMVRIKEKLRCLWKDSGFFPQTLFLSQLSTLWSQLSKLRAQVRNFIKFMIANYKSIASHLEAVRQSD